MGTCRTNRKGRRRTALTLATLTVILAGPPAAAATTSDQPELAEIAQVEADLDNAEAVLARTQKDQAEAAELAAATAKEARAATAAEATVRETERETARRLAKAEAAARQAEAELGELVRSAYRHNAPIAQLAAILEAETWQDAISRASEIAKMVTTQSVIVNRVEETRAAVEAERARRAHQLRVAERAVAHASARAVAAEQQHADATAATEAAHAAVDQRKLTLKTLQEELAQAAPATAAKASGQLTLQFPVSGEITSPFGPRVHPVTGEQKLHTGTDFRAPCGTDVRAAAAGQVREAGYVGANGNRVVIEHGRIGGAAVATTYNHLSSIAVAPGDQLVAGDLVGRAGTTGLSTGCHLHFEVRVDDEFTDPMSWLTG